MLSRHQPEPGSKLASLAEGSAVADGRDRRRRDERSYSWCLTQAFAGCVLDRDDFDLPIHSFDLALHLFPLPPEVIEQPAKPRREVLFGIFEDGRRLVAQGGAAFREGNAALQHEAADLVDERGAPLHQAIPHAVQCLEIELVARLDRHEAHVLASDGFGDGVYIAPAGRWRVLLHCVTEGEE